MGVWNTQSVKLGWDYGQATRPVIMYIPNAGPYGDGTIVPCVLLTTYNALNSRV